MNFLFLYTELADYFIHCCRHLSDYGNVHIVRWPVNKEAPFKFEFSEKIKVYDKQQYNPEQLEKLLKEIQPDIIVCSGWVDKDYLRLVKPWFKKIPTVITCDTHWKGTLKQRMAVVLSRLFLKNRFSHVWVPGEIQVAYAKKLGFEEKQIRRGFYCCDLERFNAIYKSLQEKKNAAFPKRFLYVGRYYDFKGITDLWQAFTELCAEGTNEWELWCLGTGSVVPVQHPKIKHFGFVQPADLAPILEQTGVFVLPSRFEPWGVVVQEYAAAGFPLLLSREVGAAESFLAEGKNGYVFGKENIQEIKNSMKKIISLDQHQLLEMCRYSHTLAQNINPGQWCKTITSVINEYSK